MAVTPEEWARVFRAGWVAIPSKGEPAANALAMALAAMANEAEAITGDREAGE